MHASVRSNVPRGVCTAGETWRVFFFFFSLLFLFLTKTNRPADEERRWHDGKRSSDGSAQTCIAEGNPLSTRRRCRRRGASQSMPSTQANEPKGNNKKHTLTIIARPEKCSLGHTSVKRSAFRYTFPTRIVFLPIIRTDANEPGKLLSVGWVRKEAKRCRFSAVST